jgi:hypothetical protein
MQRLVYLTLLTAVVTACGGTDPRADVVASVQVDETHDVVVVRAEQADLTPVLHVCRVPHGESTAPDRSGCASVDPWRWSRTSISASLDPGPVSALVVVVHDEARFDLVQPLSLRPSQAVELHIPAGPIGSLAPLTLNVMVAESDLTADQAIGCLASGLAGGANPVFITASMATPDTTTTPVPPADLQAACV